MMDLQQTAHRRYNPLRREWVLVSPHRTQRPWQGQSESVSTATRLSYDPNCYLCPGNSRAGGMRNPAYISTFVFDNDFPALQSAPIDLAPESNGLLRAEPERGVCRVVCFSPDHSLTMGTMDVDQVRAVVDTWIGQYDELLRLPFIRYVQIFENRGEMMGCSNPHPHSQIWASESIPNEIVTEQASFDAWSEAHGCCLLCSYLAAEQRAAERIVLENESFVTLVPFWAVWPFETLLLPKRHVSSISDLTESERGDLASMLRNVAASYDAIFSVPFPYTMGFHQGSHLHAHYYPPLLRSATVRKFMVGY
ncbi:MAG TPA: UDP-glucose--hexose-1-phosphate uridylyltransferase, partial [Bryobacteraceae bacterium]|nr:UDP-glucose--hexose-1-phosphate uridylyltransferase [Bryobacteraceae bacterium]